MDGAHESGLSRLLLPNPASHRLDVVFIHGLNGHRSRTWRNEDSDIWPLWLRDNLDGLSAWTYGYDASIAIGSKDSIVLHSIRFLSSLVEQRVGKSETGSQVPIVFVAHSLGGILVKSAIYECRSPNQAHSYIFDATAGIIFLGTPHRGSQWASRLAFAQLGMSLFFSQAELVRLLRARSNDLATITERFNSVWGSKPILSCRETKRIFGIGMIVRKQDARTNCVGETVIDIDADHRRLAKPSSPSAPVYQAILEFLRACQQTPSQSNSSLDLPLTPSPDEPRQTLTKEEKQRRRILRQQLWTQLHSPPKPDQDAWLPISEDFETEEDEGKLSKWLGGIYICKFPPQTGDTTIQIELDITQPLTPVSWIIQTSPDNPFYPGRHMGKLEFPPGFPMEQVYIIWLSPIFSPFVRFGGGGQGDVSSPFDLGKWSPYYTVQHVLQAVANILTFEPLCQNPPPLDRGIVEIPWKFSDLSGAAGYASHDEDAFFHAAQFFSRVYNRVGQESYDPPVLESQRMASITVVRELVGYYLGGRAPRVGRGQGSADFVKAFNAVATNSEWIAEEKRWADALSVACGLGFKELELQVRVLGLDGVTDRG